MPERPYTLLSCAMSLDGYIGRAAPSRLRLSSDADFDRVDAVRAGCDAILVGAGTIRRDNPRLLVRSQVRREARVARGLPPSPLKVTVSGCGKLDPDCDFFTGAADTLVYCPSAQLEETRSRLGAEVTVVDGGRAVRMRAVSEDLWARGVRRLLVEGGGEVLTQFLAEDLTDELHLVVAPLLVGDPYACRFVNAGRFPWNDARRAPLVEVRQLDDVVLLRYALSERSRLP